MFIILIKSLCCSYFYNYSRLNNMNTDYWLENRWARHQKYKSIVAFFLVNQFLLT